MGWTPPHLRTAEQARHAAQRRRFAARRNSGARGWWRHVTPITIALPLAVFTGIVLWGGGPEAVSRESAARIDKNDESGGDTIRARFTRCVGPVRTTCVVDGDTIWLGGTKIRIADIDAPEVSKPRCAAEARMGELATRRLTELLNSGDFAVLPNPDGRDEDPYGRKLRIIARGGESLGDRLVAEGLAEQWGRARIAWC